MPAVASACGTRYTFVMLLRSFSLIEDEAVAGDDEAADAQALAEYEAKGGISHQAVMTWVESWGTARELPPPNIGD